MLHEITLGSGVRLSRTIASSESVSENRNRTPDIKEKPDHTPVSDRISSFCIFLYHVFYPDFYPQLV